MNISVLSTRIRFAAAIAAGVLVALLLSYLAVIVFMLITVGIPLGAKSRPLTVNQSALLLVAAAAASAAGARTSAWCAPERRRWAAFGVGAILAVVMAMGFRGPNSWPKGWGITVAAAMVTGCVLSEAVRARSRRPIARR